MGVVLLDRQIDGEKNRRLSSHQLTIGMLCSLELKEARPVANWFQSLFSSLDTRSKSNSQNYKFSDLISPIVTGTSTPALQGLDYNGSSFLDMFRNMEGNSYLEESGFGDLFNFDSMDEDPKLGENLFDGL